MPYDKLVQQKRIQPYQAKSEEIRQLLKLATRDLATAERNLAEDHDWSFTIAYNAILQAARAYIFAQSYRPRGAEQHGTVVQFIEEALGKNYSTQIALFDQMRRKRHRVVYEQMGLVSESEAKQAIAFAKAFVEEIRLLITKQLRLKW